MTGVVKGSRPYVSPRRTQAAAATREAILDSAQRLFEHDGYVATSVPAIATDAQVATKTVYLAFGSKPLLLRAVWERRLAGEEAEVPVLERAWYRQLEEAADPRVLLGLLARQSCNVKSRSGRLLEVIRAAASADDDARSLWHDIEAKLLTVARAVVQELAAAGWLRTGLDLAPAADATWFLYHPSTWQLLVVQRGWSPETYTAWLERALAAELLDDAHASPPDHP